MMPNPPATREMFEDSEESDFITLMRAYDFAKSNRFSFDRCRSHGINAQVARQVDETYKQILHSAHQQKPLRPRGHTRQLRQKTTTPCCVASWPASSTNSPNAANPASPGATSPSKGKASWCAKAWCKTPHFSSPPISDKPPRAARTLTLLSLATAVKPAWIAEMFPQHLSTTVEHLFDAKNKRVAAMKLVRYRDLVIEQKAQQRRPRPTRQRPLPSRSPRAAEPSS